jgi:hypothetical protein
MKLQRIATTLTLLAALSSPAALAQNIPYDLEIGFRWLSVSGSEAMYRTQINERSGFLLRGLTLTTTDFDGHTTLVDRFRIDVSELGAGPAGSLRIEAGRQDLYRLRFGYRTADLYSALPTFTNLYLAEGIFPGQQTYDRRRDMIDLDVELMPGRSVVPFIGYSWNRLDGPGTTTFALGGDEFLLGSDLNERGSELRAGAAFNFNNVYGVVTQGWRDHRSTELLTLAPGAEAGNNPNPVLGRPVFSETITRDSRTDVRSPYTQLFVTAQPLQRLRLVANYDRFTADADGLENETAAGSYVSFALGRFFGGRVEDIVSSARNTTWRSGIRGEYALTNHVSISAGAKRQHRELDGSALISTVFLQSITFGGVDPRDLERVLSTNNALERDEDVLSVGVIARALGPITLRGEFTETRQDVLVEPDIAQIIVPGSQGGAFDRRVRSLEGAASYALNRLTIGASARRDRADEAVLRTDFIDRDRFRIRAGWRTPGNLLRFGLTAEEMNQENARPGIDFDSTFRQFSGDVEVAPHTAVRLRGSFSRFDADSVMTIRRPENFRLETSAYTQRGDAIEAGVMLLLAPFTFDASAGRIENEGNAPFSIDRYRARLGYDVNERIGVIGEWSSDRYDDPLLAFADYDANRIGLFLRLRP